MRTWVSNSKQTCQPAWKKKKSSNRVQNLVNYFEVRNRPVRVQKLRDCDSRIVEYRCTNWRGHEIHKTVFSQKCDTKPRVLGQEWNVQDDKLNINFSNILSAATSDIVTKKSALSLLARVFDPVGLISPIVLTSKQLFQELCKRNVSGMNSLMKHSAKGGKHWLRACKKLTPF